MQNASHPTPLIDNTNYHRLPDALLEGRRFRNWMWWFNPSTEKAVKLPVHADFGARLPDENGQVRYFGNKRVNRETGEIESFNGHSLEHAMTYEEAMEHVGNGTRGLGIVTGLTDTAFDMFVVDIDHKDYDGPTDTVNGHVMPASVAHFSRLVVSDGGYSEVSPSRNGSRHIIPGRLPTEDHATRFNMTDFKELKFTPDEKGKSDNGKLVPVQFPPEFGTPEQLAKIDIEIYSRDRYLTLTGNHLHEVDGEGQCTWTNTNPNCERLINMWWNFLVKHKSARTIKPGAGTVTLAELGKAEFIAPERLAAPLDAPMKSAYYRGLWNGDLSVLKSGDKSGSTARWSLLSMLCALTGGDAQAMAAWFLSSALATEKVLTQRNGRPLLEMEIERVIGAWDGQPWKAAVAHTGAASDAQRPEWSPEQQERLLFRVVNSAKGGSMQKAAFRAALHDIFDRMNAGEWHPDSGLCVVRVGGLRQMSERVGGRPDQLHDRLRWLAAQGIIARLETDTQGSPVIYMNMRGVDCAALEGLQQPELSMPGRKATVSPRAAGERKPRVKDPLAPARIPAQLNRARWTMWMIHRGERTVNGISERSGTAKRTVQQHVKVLQGREFITAALEPLVSPAEFEQARINELRETQAQSRQRRTEDSAKWRTFKSAPVALPNAA
ncbi:hypothetical protein [Deinococcus sedimenti]|uniref:Uncharacterized protein n=1 Tax=Deinococcus sedimenti TaxID=1867090 RepID=A0ABQ2S060_9DEIO|nr:hypothetical protein [Deinococcus sedimenti]GGR84350.1 hypothetical protein GCM10008960_09220 [Deinococcus sedimenti]